MVERSRPRLEVPCHGIVKNGQQVQRKLLVALILAAIATAPVAVAGGARYRVRVVGDGPEGWLLGVNLRAAPWPTDDR